MQTKTIVGVCKLCQTAAQLQASHIYPKFTYRRMRSPDISNRFVLFSTGNPEQADGAEMQDGYKEHLLCWDCEQRLQKWEDYFARLVNQKRVFDIVHDPKKRWVRLEGLDYQKTKLYLTSLLWRSAVTSDPSFRSVNLGPSHSERLRRMLLDSDPGAAAEYGCLITVPYIRQDDDTLISRIAATSNPDNVRCGHGLRLVRMMVDGILLQFAIGALPLVQRNTALCQLFLQLDDSVRVDTEDAMKIAYVRDGWKETILRAPSGSAP